MLKPIFSFFNAGGLLKDSSVLLVGMGCVHVFNVLFQMVMGRCLLEEEYAMLISLLGVLSIITIPMGVVSSSINRYSSLLIQQGRTGDIRRLVMRWGSRMLALGALLSTFCYLFPDALATFFHLERTAPILIFGFIIIGIFCRPVFDGALMGMQYFVGYSMSNILGWGTRLVMGSLLVVLVSAYAGWGLLGHGLGFYVAFGIGVLLVFRKLRNQAVTRQPLPKMHAFMFGSFFILLGYSILMTGDVIMVKHLFPEQAPTFAFAATLGRLVIFIPQAFIAAMFPKVVSDGGASVEQRKVFTRALIATLALTMLSVAAFVPLTRLGILIMYGNAEPLPELVRWSRLLSVTMIPVALLGVASRFVLAQYRLAVALVVPFAAILYIVFSMLFTTSPDGVLCALGGTSFVAMLLLLSSIFINKEAVSVGKVGVPER